MLFFVLVLLAASEFAFRTWGYTILAPSWHGRPGGPPPPWIPMWAHIFPGWEDAAIAAREQERADELGRMFQHNQLDQFVLDTSVAQLKMMSYDLDWRAEVRQWNESHNV